MKLKHIYLMFLFLILLMSITSCKYECDKCYDKGVIRCVICNGKGHSKCNVCEGKERTLCNKCGGTGFINKPDTIKGDVQIICSSCRDGYAKCSNCDSNDQECTICDNGYVRCYYCQGKKYKDET